MDKVKSNFNPQKYLNGKINSQHCNHELLMTNAFNDGRYGYQYDCLICGKHIHLIGSSFPCTEDNHFIYISCFSQFDTKLIQTLLQFVCERYKSEESIDIVSIFQKMQKSIEEIDNVIEISSDKERKDTLQYYNNLIKENPKDKGISRKRKL